MIRLKLLDDCDEPAWDDRVAAFEGGTIFHTQAWMRVIEKLHRADRLPIGIFDGSEMVGVLPLFRRRRGFLTILASPLGSVGYGGPLVHPSHLPVVMEQLDNLLKRFGADYFELRSLDKIAPVALTERQYDIRELQTCVVSINRKSQELFTSLEKECRTAIRRAWKENIKIVEATDKQFCEVYYQMARDTWAKANRPPPLAARDYGVVWDILKPYNRIKVLLAQYQGRVVAGGIFPRFNHKVYFWDGASFPAYYRLAPNNLLHWTLIEWGAENGLTQYDMLGANIPSIARFKQSFGGELNGYTYAYKDITLPAHLGRRLYRWLVPRMRQLQFRLRHVSLVSEGGTGQ